MYVQLTDKDRKVIEFRWHGSMTTKDGNDPNAEWETIEGKPQVVAIVRDDMDTYQVLSTSEEAEARNEWTLNWRDDRFDKAFRFFGDMVCDFEIEEVHWHNNQARLARKTEAGA